MELSREERTISTLVAIVGNEQLRLAEKDYSFYLKKDEWTIIEVIRLFITDPEQVRDFYILMESSRKAGKLKPSRYERPNPYPNNNEYSYYYDPFTITHWAIVKGITIPDILTKWHDQQLKLREERPLNKTEADAPVPAYYSDHLKILIQASGYFWANAEKSEKDTHPKNEKVVAWLVEKGFSAISAKQGATIIRPKWAAKGNY